MLVPEPGTFESGKLISKDNVGIDQHSPTRVGQHTGGVVEVTGKIVPPRNDRVNDIY